MDIRAGTQKNRGKPTYHGKVSVYIDGCRIYTLHVDAERITRDDAKNDAEHLKQDIILSTKEDD